jgi:hypothetical protein
MKDSRHHLRHVQRKVMQHARHQASRASGSSSQQLVMAGPVESAAVVDWDNKRKGPSDFVRPVYQRDRR